MRSNGQMNLNFFCQEAKLIIKQYLEKIVTPIKVVIPSLNTGSKYCEY